MSPIMSPPLPAPAANAHPLVKFLYETLQARGLARSFVENRAGLGSNTMASWWNGERAIILQNMEAALGACGYSLKPVPAAETRFGATYSAPTLFTVGKHKMRNGQTAEITRIERGVIFGSYQNGHMGAIWNAAGRRTPVAGEDPTDLILPDERKTS
jgi:transcriptional regulator with XRE-family HTH domain